MFVPCSACSNCLPCSLRAIVAILQISAPANDAVTRYLALSSLICALLSLIYGCIYIIRFGSMKKAFKAAMWAAVGALNCRILQIVSEHLSMNLIGSAEVDYMPTMERLGLPCDASNLASMVRERLSSLLQ